MTYSSTKNHSVRRETKSPPSSRDAVSQKITLETKFKSPLSSRDAIEVPTSYVSIRQPPLLEFDHKYMIPEGEYVLDVLHRVSLIAPEIARASQKSVTSTREDKSTMILGFLTLKTRFVYVRDFRGMLSCVAVGISARASLDLQVTVSYHDVWFPQLSRRLSVEATTDDFKIRTQTKLVARSL
jgi:hypothetical protein